MKLAVGSDHAGFGLKEELKDLLESEGHAVEDCGCYSEESCDYPDFAHKLCDSLQNKKVERGILVCGTGLGMSYTANRHNGIRAALCTNVEMAEMSRAHNDANVLVLGSRITEADVAKKILRAWMETPFDGGRHLKRILKIDGIE